MATIRGKPTANTDRTIERWSTLELGRVIRAVAAQGPRPPTLRDVCAALQKSGVIQQDIRQTVPEGEFDLILCRNAVLTYFEPALQHEVMGRVVARLRPGGALVIGMHESLPENLQGFVPWHGARAIYRKLTAAAA
jgi:trans-aconitate methyltransferase